MAVIDRTRRHTTLRRVLALAAAAGGLGGCGLAGPGGRGPSQAPAQAQQAAAGRRAAERVRQHTEGTQRQAGSRRWRQHGRGAQAPPASSALGVLGAPGMAAYFGLLDLARLRAGERVLVSAAASAAGAMAGQVAVLKGARAIGIAATREECDWVVRHARLAACINEAGEDVGARLTHLAPRGVDVYFDN